MRVEKLSSKGTWREVADSARVTIGLEEGEKKVSQKWIKQILLAEHSPIRLIRYSWIWKDIPTWVSVHFVRHWLGIIHFVKTSRSDRTGIAREKLPQDNLINHKAEANVQALINISRKRLCMKASPETREAWQMVRDAVASKDPVLGIVMQRECIYRGFCPEFNSCGFSETREYELDLEIYRDTEYFY